ncbi:MAG: hypothetical protein MOB07_08385, partial [Acidobacteria bacterium]|nr:hypothetical protein [Acidobacteriota bacterium]
AWVLRLAREDAGAPLERRLLDLFFKDHKRPQEHALDFTSRQTAGLFALRESPMNRAELLLFRTLSVPSRHHSQTPWLGFHKEFVYGVCLIRSNSSATPVKAFG